MLLAFGAEDQILAELDEGMRQAAQRPVAIKRIALELAGIRNIVANLDVRDGAQAFEQSERQSRVLVPQHADRPRARHALPGLGEAVHRDKHRRFAGGDRRIDGLLDRRVVRPVIARDAGFDLSRRQIHIARHHQPVGDLHDERRVVEPAIGVNQEAGETGKDGRRAERPCQMLGHLRGAQVVGDVPVKVLGPKPKRAVALRDSVLGVVAEDEKAGRGVPVDAPIGLGAQVFLVKSVQS